jgi:ribonuclease HI
MSVHIALISLMIFSNLTIQHCQYTSIWSPLRIMENLDRNYRSRSIYILCDSQAALKALDKHQINSQLVWDCHQTLMERAKHNGVQLIWVPGHEGIAGNEDRKSVV